MSDKTNTDNENTMYIPSDTDSALPHLQRIQQNRNSRLKPVKRVRQDNQQNPMSRDYNPNQQYYNQNQQNTAYNPNQQYFNQSPAYNPGQQYYGQNQQNINYDPNQQNVVYNPNQYNSAYAPNQQYYNPNQQNTAYNPNQQYYNQNYQNTPYVQPVQQAYYDNRQTVPNQKKSNNNSGKKKSNSNSKSANSGKKNKKKKKHHKSVFGRFLSRLMWSLFTVLIVLFGLYSCTSLTFINKVNKTETGDRNRTSGALSKSYVSSILVIGTDGRSLDEQGRSDSMILLSLNRRTKQVNLTSFMRDSYVDIPGYGWDKLNASYAYGGAELLMDTIEQNFRVKIDDYITINFMSFTDIVDSIGGIDIDVTDEEAQEINVILQSEVNALMGDDIFSDFLDGGGKLHLNGKQALSFARIRNVGNSDFERTERQREVFKKILDKATKISPSIFTRFGNIASNVVPQLTTNMSTWGMYLFSLKLPFAVTYDIQQLQIPYENTFYPDDYTESGSVLVVDFDSNYNVLEEKVFGS